MQLNWCLVIQDITFYFCCFVIYTWTDVCVWGTYSKLQRVTENKVECHLDNQE